MATATDGRRAERDVLRWRGVMGASPRMLRWMVALLLTVAGAALTFTQSGFVAVSLPDGTVGYVVVLLQVVALASLLLGTVPGTCLGLLIGCVLFAHAWYLPLDHYELTFVTPVTSVVMFAASGFLLGLLFALALRNNPAKGRRAAYIALVCAVVSWLYCTAFVFSVVVSLAEKIVARVGSDVADSYVQQLAGSTAMQMGDLVVQAWSTALLMAALCCIVDWAVRKGILQRDSLRLRTVFGAWLAIVLATGFLALSAASFAVITSDQLRDAEDLMRSETNYLCTQLADGLDHSRAVAHLMEQAGVDLDALDADAWDAFFEAVADQDLLRGYTLEDDGTLIVTVGGLIEMSNNDVYERFDVVEGAFSPNFAEAVARSLKTGRMERFVYDGPASAFGQSDEGIADQRPYIAYLLAKGLTLPNVEGDQFEYTVIMMQPSDQVFEKRASVMVWMSVAELVLMVAVFGIVFLLLNRLVASRIDEENEALSLITAGDLDARAQAGGTYEFDSLSRGINATVDALKGWIREAETRMDAELATARAIQEAALPRDFPPYPDILRFDIYAGMDPAKEVAGDFYDFFLIGDGCGANEGRLGFVVADVSGKGVPAALLMMKAKALLRDYMTSGMELGEAVEEANRQLVDGNGEGMFVTAWVGVLDYGTGRVDYVNAGHNPPLLWQREGGWRWLRQRSGPILGLFDLPYRAFSVECAAGDTFLLYTDGVTEAFSSDGRAYGEARLISTVERGYRLHPRELIESVRADVEAHVDGAEQSDDITILALEVGVPPEVTTVLEVPAEVDRLGCVNAFLHDELEARHCPQRVQNQLDIAVEELFVNVCRYAYPDNAPGDPGSVRIQRTYSSDPPSVTVDIIDEGIPYDPLAKPDAVTPSDIKDVPIGGLGILMAKRCTDEMRYERADGANVVTIVKRW